MSDLDRRLSEAARAASRRATPPSAGRIITQAHARRQQRRRVAVAVPAVAALALLGGVGLAHLHGGGASSGSASVEAGPTAGASAGPAGASSSTSATAGRSASEAPLSMTGTGAAGVLKLFEPESMKEVTAPSGVRTCTVTGGGVTAYVPPTFFGSLRPDPIAVRAVWLPALASSGCRSTVADAGQAVAARLARSILSNIDSSASLGCVATPGGSVDLAFGYATGKLAVVRVHLDGCEYAVLPDGKSAPGGVDGLAALHPPAWATSQLAP